MKRVRSWIAVIVAPLLVACGGAAPPDPPARPVANVAKVAPPAPARESRTPPGETPDAPFRAHRPAAGPIAPFTPPTIESFALRNGLPIHLVERHDLPVVVVDVVVRGGTAALDRADHFAGRALGSLMPKGTSHRSALAIADGFQALGATYDVSVNVDAARANVKALAPDLERALDLLSDVVLHPTFPADEIARLKAEWGAREEQQKLDMDLLSWSATELALYGPAHPYGRPPIADRSDVAAITRASLVRAHARAFDPSRAAIVVVGDTTRASVAPLLEKAFGAFRPVAPPAAAPPVVPPAPSGAGGAPRIVLVDRPGATQSIVLLAEPALAYGSPDRHAFRLMSVILGGFWMSRLNANLREEKGYSYWVSSSTNGRRVAGPFRAGGAMLAEKTSAAITEMLGEVRRMRDQPVSKEELDGAKTFLTHFLRAPFETAAGTAGALAFLLTYELPLDDWRTQAARIDAVTAEGVKAVATKYLHPDAMRIIVVGDRAKVEGGLAALGLGDVELRDAFGKLARPR